MEVNHVVQQQTEKKSKSKKETKYPFGLILPVIACLGIIPLIMYYHVYDTGLSQYSWYTSYSSSVDFFLYHKMVWLIITGIYILFCLAYLIFAEEKKAPWIRMMIPIAVYAAITFLSALLSINMHFSFHGIYEQFESVWTLLGYALFVYYGFFIMRSENAVKRTIKWFMPFLTIMCLLGLSQVFSHDFFRTSLGQHLITPADYAGGKLQFSFALGRPYLTLYNPNYVGFYVAMLVPLLVTLIFAVLQKKNTEEKTFNLHKILRVIGYAVLIIFLFLILYASQSRSGILALFVSLFIMLLFLRKIVLKHWIVPVLGVLVIVSAFIGINHMNQDVLSTRMKDMFNFTKETHDIQAIQTNKTNVSVKYKGNLVKIYVKQDSKGSDQFTIKDASGKKLSMKLENSAYQIQDSRFPFRLTSVRSDSFNGFSVYIPDSNTTIAESYKTWYFTNMMKGNNDTSFYVLGGNNALMKMAKPEKTWSFLENHYHFANMRGFIWARTLPLLKKYFLFGSGPDTFIIAFPNNDLLGLYNSGHVGEIITKPHCMYLQVGVQTGVISLIALLTFFLWYLGSSIRLYWKHQFDNYMSFVGIGIFTGVIGYLILGLTNDSCTAVAPIFYTLLGIGVGVNEYIKKQRKEDEKRQLLESSKVTEKAESDTVITEKEKTPEHTMKQQTEKVQTAKIKNKNQNQKKKNSHR